MNNKVNLRLYSILNHLEITQKKLAEDLQITRQTLEKNLKGISYPNYATIFKLKEYYPEINMNWLISGEGDMIIKNIENNILEEPIAKYSNSYKDEEIIKLIKTQTDINSKVIKLLEDKKS